MQMQRAPFLPTSKALWTSIAASALLFPISRAFAGTPLPSTMVRAEFVSQSSALLQNSAQQKPKTVWRAGETFLAMREHADFENGLEPLVIVKNSETWILNLFTRSGRHSTGGTTDSASHVPIFAFSRNKSLAGLELGKEAEFFDAHQASKAGGDPIRGKETIRRELKLGDVSLSLISEKVSGHPIMVEKKERGDIERFEYLSFETVAFDPKIFSVPAGVRVEETQPLTEGLKNPSNSWIGDFLVHYHERPQPERLLAFIKSLGEENQIEKSWSLIGFVAPLMASNPKLLESWIEAGKTQNADMRHFLALSLRQCGTTECKKLLAKNPYNFDPEGMPSFAAVKPLQIGALPLNDPRALDFIWAEFLATGNVAGAERVAKLVARGVNASGANISPYPESVIVEAAHWSLVSNARQHAKVREVVAKASAKDDVMKRILAEIDNPELTRPNPQPHRAEEFDSEQ